jgi:hypothetical protein
LRDWERTASIALATTRIENPVSVNVKLSTIDQTRVIGDPVRAPGQSPQAMKARLGTKKTEEIGLPEHSQLLSVLPPKLALNQFCEQCRLCDEPNLFPYNSLSRT